MLSEVDKALLSIARDRKKEEVRLAKEQQRERDKLDIRLRGIHQQKRRCK